MISPGVELLSGLVVGDSPLEIRLDSAGKMIVGGASLCVPADYKRRSVKMEIDGEIKNVVVDNRLCVGEEVFLLWLVREKRFVVLGRG